MTLYDVLQVRPDASPGIIDAVYLALVKQATGDPARIAELTEAYQVLSDPARRAEYDATGPAASATPSAAAPVEAHPAPVAAHPATAAGPVDLPSAPGYVPGYEASHDVAVWHAVQINELLDIGRMDAWPGAAPTFRPLFADQGEHMLAGGPVVVYDHGATGDGSYRHDGGSFIALGDRYALAATIGIMAGKAIGNARREKRAAQAATPHWHEIGRGQLWVSSTAFYLVTPGGFVPALYENVFAAELVEPRRLWINSVSDDDQLSWTIESDHAELLFTIWARYANPQHPQFAGGRWVPPGWRDRITRLGFPLPAPLAARSHLTGILAPPPAS